MKIAHFLLGRVNPESSNGIDKTVYFLSQAQARFGHDVTVFSITALSRLPVPNVDVRTFPPRPLPVQLPFGRPQPTPPRNALRLPPNMLSDLLGWAPDMVHFHSVHIPESIWVAHRLRRVGIPYCVTPHGALSMTGQSRRRQARKRVFGALFEARYLNRAAFLHAVSEEELRRLRAQRPEVPTMLARNCIDLAVVPMNSDSDYLPRRFPELHGRRVVTYLGRLDPDQKGLDLLLHSWAKVHEGSRMTLLVVGPDWRGGRIRLQSLARELAITGSVLFAPPVSGNEKWDVFAGSQFFVHPSRWEGAPFTVLEAMAAGKPVLATHAADPDGFIRRYQAGLVVPADIQSLASALKRMDACSERELQEMAKNARRLIEQEFRWDDTAMTLLRAYEEAIRSLSPPQSP